MNYYIEPLTQDKLRKLIKKTGLRPIDVVRKKEPAFKALRLSEATPDVEVIKAMVDNPDLLQRPIVEAGDRAVLARPAERALDLLQ